MISYFLLCARLCYYEENNYIRIVHIFGNKFIVHH